MKPGHKHMEGVPLSLVGPVDLGRLLRELEMIDNTLREWQLRAPGQEVKLPKTSGMMDQLIGLNKLNLLEQTDRQTLKDFLGTIKQRAPRLHLSFSADPSPLFIEKLMAWLRREVHPVVLVTIGLQPNIGAGCLVRTTNKYFDLSLAKDLAKHRDDLLKVLHEVNKSAEPAAEAAETTA